MPLTTIEVETLTAVKNAARKFLKDDIDWEQRRYELVKQILPTIKRDTPKEMVDVACEIADAAIARLRLKC